MNFTVVDSFKH